MPDPDLLLARLARAGLTGATAAVPVTGGVIATAALVTLGDGSRVFAKTLPTPPAGLFEVEADGLRALRRLGGVNTPAVLRAAPDLLVLEQLRPRRDQPQFWERLGQMVAGLHTATVASRFGWQRDGWLGRLRQDNTWDEDGHAFFAQRRILRWLPEPLVAEAFDAAARRALERLAERLPELVPVRPAALTHGDLWAGNVLADRSGTPVLIDPAISCTWPEVDLSMLWCSTRPPESERFFAVYEEATGIGRDWRGWAPILHLRELLSTIAHGDDDWGAADAVRKVIAPFRG